LKDPIGEHYVYLSILVFFASYGILSLKNPYTYISIYLSALATK